MYGDLDCGCMGFLWAFWSNSGELFINNVCSPFPRKTQNWSKLDFTKKFQETDPLRRDFFETAVVDSEPADSSLVLRS